MVLAAHQDTPTTSGERKGVVITGGSRGFGYALAVEMLRGGDAVFICGRNRRQLDGALASLRQQFGDDRAHGMVCDVSDAQQVSQLGAAAAKALGTIHLWINNAGQVTEKKLLADVAPNDIVSAVGTNVLGSMLCSAEAIRIMRQQPSCTTPQYHIFNFGFSGWGAAFSQTAATHKTTKTALTQLTASLRDELKEAGVTSIGVHNLSPGMVLTDLLLKDSTPAARRFFNALAEEPETVAAALAPKIRSVQGSGTSVDYLSPIDAFSRVLSRVPQIVNGGRFFDKGGNRVGEQNEAYLSNGVRVQHDGVVDS